VFAFIFGICIKNSTKIEEKYFFSNKKDIIFKKYYKIRNIALKLKET
jgi:hypothetical protein